MAQFNTFYIPMTDDGAAADRLNVFLRSHRVLSVKQRDFPEGWGFCVEWIDGTAPTMVAGARDARPYQREKVDYMNVLDPDEFTRFSEYRKRRREISEADGVKPFVVMTDAQMAELAKMQNPTVADLKKIGGFGEARAEKYGERILGVGEAARVPLPRSEASDRGSDTLVASEEIVAT